MQTQSQSEPIDHLPFYGFYMVAIIFAHFLALAWTSLLFVIVVGILTLYLGVCFFRDALRVTKKAWPVFGLLAFSIAVFVISAPMVCITGPNIEQFYRARFVLTVDEGIGMIDAAILFVLSIVLCFTKPKQIRKTFSNQE